MEKLAVEISIVDFHTPRIDDMDSESITQYMLERFTQLAWNHLVFNRWTVEYNGYTLDIEDDTYHHNFVLTTEVDSRIKLLIDLDGGPLA